jgi:hypothetical protein
MGYRLSRNLEASLIDYFRAALITDSWVGVQCEKSLKQSEIKLPCILIYCSNTDTQKKEIGSGEYIKYPNIVIRIYGTNEGNREDLADWVLEKLEGTINYYTYTNGGETKSQVAGGISIIKIIRDTKELSSTDPEAIEFRDRYRHVLEVSCLVGEI